MYVAVDLIPIWHGREIQEIGAVETYLNVTCSDDRIGQDLS